MATQQTRGVAWTTCIGRDGGSNPFTIAEDQGQEVQNMEFTDALGRKRDGCSLVPVTLASGAAAMTIHFPSQVSAEAWFVVVTLVAGAGAIIVYPAGPSSGTTTTPAGVDAIDLTTPLEFSSFVTHEGKLFWAYNSGINRLHVLNNDLIVPFVRRAGLLAPSAPFVSNTGVGTYPATLRYYRTQSKAILGTTVLRVSNLGGVSPFTPSGAGLAARVNFPGAPLEGATHWTVYGSADNLAYYRLSNDLPLATTSFDDTRNPVTEYPLLELAPLEGANTPFPSVKYLASDGRHLFGFGVWEATDTGGTSLTPVPGRVYFTPAIGTSDSGDSERVSNTLELRGWIDMTPFGGAVDRGISGPVNNRIYVFQNRGIYVLVPTGDEVTPFARVVLSTTYGSESHWSQVIAEDEQGQPAVYFLDPRDGPRRIANGSVVQWLGHDVTDLWATVNHESTGPAYGIYDQVNKLVKWWVPTGASNSPNLMLVYDVRRGRIHDTQQEVRGGFSKWTGLLVSARCATMYFADWTLLKSTATAKFVAYVGLTTNAVVRQDRLSITDNGTPFEAFIRSWVLTGPTVRRQKRLMEAFLIASSPAASITLSMDISGNFDALSVSQQKVLTSSGIRKKLFFEDIEMADLFAYQVRLGDDASLGVGSLNQTWELDQWHGGEELEAGAR